MSFHELQIQTVVSPAVGALSAAAVHPWSPLHHLRIEVAKVYHRKHDPHGIFR